MRSRIMFVVVLVLALSQGAFAETVRGKVVYSDGATAYPNVEVTLISAAGKATVYTGSDGMFQLVRVPPGHYRVEIKSPRERKSLDITVAAQPYTDLPPVALD